MTAGPCAGTHIRFLREHADIRQRCILACDKDERLHITDHFLHRDDDPDITHTDILFAVIGFDPADKLGLSAADRDIF